MKQIRHTCGTTTREAYLKEANRQAYHTQSHVAHISQPRTTALTHYLPTGYVTTFMEESNDFLEV